MVLVGVHRVALVAIGPALGASGLQMGTSAGGGSGAPSQPAVETTQIDPRSATFTVSSLPTRLALDIASASAGDRSGTLAGLRYADGITKHPTASIDADDGVTPTLGATGPGAIPAGPSPQVHVIVPGYSHLDVVNAAHTQNNGKPEEVSSTLAGWASRVVGPPAP